MIKIFGNFITLEECKQLGETPRILWMFGAHRPYKDFIMDQNP